MGPYAYAIKINRDKQEIKTETHVEITGDMLDSNGNWTIEKLKEVVGGNPFYFLREEGDFDRTEFVVYVKTRLETDEEQQARVTKEELYMEKYAAQKIKRELELKERAQKIKNKGG